MNAPKTWTLEQKTHSLESAIDFIVSASAHGDIDELKDLWATVVEKFPCMDTVEEEDLKTRPLQHAAAAGHLAVVNHLIPLSAFNPKSDALNCATRNGHLECLQALAPHYPPAMLSVALTEAACANHVECVMALLKMDPPNIDDDYEVCLIWASANKNKQLLEYFYIRCNPDRALEISDWWEDEDLEMLVHYHSPEGQRQRLKEKIGGVQHFRRKAKI